MVQDVAQVPELLLPPLGLNPGSAKSLESWGKHQLNETCQVLLVLSCLMQSCQGVYRPLAADSTKWFASLVPKTL